MLITFFVGLIFLALYLFLALKIRQDNRIQNVLYYKTPEWFKQLIIGILLICSYFFVLDILNLENNGFTLLVIATISSMLNSIFIKPKNH
ncbi:hypothetical protein CJ191_03870 [Aerococcus viridans]|uniref:Uncharacterized protein n=1 Tax=Aerococcus viridans TaxID=1377 RepID=A0A2N6UEC3_9LACT|nr:hypothetical protein CJ191_03870 [Aerococcus viridans]